jgi:hypothetical protein
MFHFVYKTTNLVNQKIYIGVHSTEVVEDGYLGSGKYLRRAVRKYGSENFTREVLSFFKTRNEAFQYEAELVNLDFVKRKDTYNLILGGNGTNPVDLYTHELWLEKIKSLRKEGFKIPNETRAERYKRVSEQKRADGVYERLSKRNQGENNPAFKLYKDNLEKDMEVISKVIRETDIPLKFLIKTVFKKKCHIDNLIHFYQNRNFLGNYSVKVSKGYWDIRVTRNTTTTYLDFGFPKRFSCVFLRNDFVSLIPLINEFLKNSFTDSQVLNLDKMDRNIFKAISYFKVLGVIKNEKTITVYTDCVDGRKKPGKKTVFEWSFKDLNVLILDEETNTYEFDDDGGLVQKSRLILEGDGGRYSLSDLWSDCDVEKSLSRL